MRRSVKKKSRALGAKKPSFNMSEFVNRIWVVPASYALLSIMYFFKYVLGNYAVFSSETGSAFGTFEKGFSTFFNPFSEHSGLWQNLYLGGQPASQALYSYTIDIIYNILHLFFSGYRSWILYTAVITFAAGWFMYLYLRALGLRKGVSFLAGVMYMFAPVYLSQTLTMHITKMTVVSVFPLTMLCVEKLFTEQKIRYALYLGGTVALTIAVAHLQLAFFALWGIGLYGVYKLFIVFWEKRAVSRVLGTAGLFVFGVVLGLVISARAYAPQYWHTSTVSKRAVTETAGKAEPGTAGTFEYATSWSLHSEETMSLVLPQFSNFKNYWGRNAFKQNSEYFGFIALFFFIAGIFLWRREKRVRFFVFLFFFALLFALGAATPFFRVFYYLIPGIKSLRAPSLISYLFAFSAVVTAALTLEYIFGNKQERFLRNLTTLAYIFGGIGFLFLILSSKLLPLWKSIFSPDKVWGAAVEVKQQALAANVSAVSLDGLMILVMSAVLWFLIQQIGRGSMRAGIVLSIMGLLIAADTWRIDRQFLIEIPYKDIPSSEQQKIQVYERLKEFDRTLYRVFPEHILYQESQLRFSYPGVAMTTGFSDFTLKRYDKMQRYFLDYISQYREVSMPVLNLLNARYIVTTVQKSDSTLQLRFITGNGFVYQNVKALPYISFVHRYRVISNPDEVFTTVTSSGFLESGEAIIEKAPPEFALVGTDTVKPAGLSESVVLLDSADFYIGKKNTFTFQMKAEKPGLLIVSDNYHPEWTVAVDGKDAEIYQVNYLWKGVFVPAGSHNVKFVFIPKEILYSRQLSFIGILIFLIGFGIIYITNRKFKRKEEKEPIKK